MPQPTPELRADFLEWLRTGAFRGVRLGMTRAECMERLGKPDDWGYGKSKRRAGIYRWSLLEFHFATQKAPADADNDKLYLIFNDRQETSAALFGYGYDDNKIISLPEVENLLQEVGMDFSKYLVTNEKMLEEDRITVLLGEKLFAFHFFGDEGEEILHTLEQIENKRSYLKLKEIPSMSNYQAKVYVTLKPSILDPQGRTVERALLHLGHTGISGVRVGKYIELQLSGERAEVEAQMKDMAENVLSNPIMEDVVWEIEAVELEEA